MASKWPPVKNAGFTFRVYLFAQTGNQIKTSPTLAAGDFQVSIDGGTFANLGTTPSESPASSGQVLVTLTAGEMNGDEITVRAIDASGDEWHSAAWVIHTVGQTLDTIDGNVDSILEDTGTTLPATLTTIDGIVDDILVDTGTTLPATLSTISGYVDTEVAAVLAAVDTEVAAILADTNELQTNQGNWLTADVSGLATAAALATVDGIVDDILVDTGTTLPAQITALNNLSAQQVWEYVTRELTSAGAGGATAQEVWEYATRTLSANTNLNDPTAAAIADAVLDELVAGHVTAGSLSKAIIDILEDTGTTLPASFTALNDLDATEVQTAAAAALTAYDPPTKAELDSAVSPLATAAALATVDTNVDSILADTGTDGVLLAATANSAALVDSVWDEVLTGATHNVVNSAGRRLRAIPSFIAGTVNDAGATTTQFNTSLAGGYTDDHFNDQLVRFITGGAAGQVAIIVDYVDVTGAITLDEPITVQPGNGSEFEIIATHVHPKSQIADVVLDELLSGHTTAGSLGKAVADIETDATAVLADTAELQTNQGNWVTATGFSTLDAAGVRTAVGMASADLDAQLAALPTATENADALLSRDVANVEDTASTDSVAALILAALHSAMSGTDWTIYKTDDATAFVVKAITTDADAEPVTGASDPA